MEQKSQEKNSENPFKLIQIKRSKHITNQNQLQ